MKFVFSAISFSKKILFILLIIVVFTGCSSVNSITQNNKISKQKNLPDNVIEKKLKSSPAINNEIICGGIKNFIDYAWFENMENAYREKYPDDYNSYRVEECGEFYCDYPNGWPVLQACLSLDYFLFSPWEDPGRAGAFFSYDINKNSIRKSPKNTEYLSSGFNEVNDDFAFFQGGYGSGDCFSEQYGKYFYVENRIEIYKNCGGCGSEELDNNGEIVVRCEDLNIIYE